MSDLKKSINKTKGRTATPNEVAKKIILDKLESALYFCDNEYYYEAFNEDEINEIFRHLMKHTSSISKRFNLDDIDLNPL